MSDRTNVSVNVSDPLGVTISSRDIYDEVVGLRGDMRSVIETNANVVSTQADHESRIRALEKFDGAAQSELASVARWKAAIPVAFLTGCGALAVAVIK